MQMSLLKWLSIWRFPLPRPRYTRLLPMAKCRLSWYDLMVDHKLLRPGQVLTETTSLGSWNPPELFVNSLLRENRESGSCRSLINLDSRFSLKKESTMSSGEFQEPSEMESQGLRSLGRDGKFSVCVRLPVRQTSRLTSQPLSPPTTSPHSCIPSPNLLCKSKSLFFFHL